MYFSSWFWHFVGVFLAVTAISSGMHAGLVLLVVYLLYIVYLATLRRFESKIGGCDSSEDDTSATYDEDKGFSFYADNDKEVTKVCISLLL